MCETHQGCNYCCYHSYVHHYPHCLSVCSGSRCITLELCRPGKRLYVKVLGTISHPLYYDGVCRSACISSQNRPAQKKLREILGLLRGFHSPVYSLPARHTGPD